MTDLREMPQATEAVEASTEKVNIYDFLTAFEFSEKDKQKPLPTGGYSKDFYFFAEGDSEKPGVYVKVIITTSPKKGEPPESRTYSFDAYEAVENETVLNGETKMLKGRMKPPVGKLSRSVSGSKDLLLQSQAPLKDIIDNPMMLPTDRPTYLIETSIACVHARTGAVTYNL